MCAFLLCNLQGHQILTALEHCLKMSDFPKLSKGTGIPFFEGSSFRMNHFGSKKSLYYMAFWIVEPVLVWLASKIFVPSEVSAAQFLTLQVFMRFETLV